MEKSLAKPIEINGSTETMSRVYMSQYNFLLGEPVKAAEKHKFVLIEMAKLEISPTRNIFLYSNP